jgi:hypothetical protein
MTDEEYARYSPWQQQRYVRADLVSEYPANVWVRANEHDNGCQATLGPAPDAVRYVRADLYDAALALAERRVDALQARLAVVRSWGEAPCLEPLGTDYPR